MLLGHLVLARVAVPRAGHTGGHNLLDDRGVQGRAQRVTPQDHRLAEDVQLLIE